MEISGLTPTPNAAWVRQAGRNPINGDDGFLLGARYLQLDRDKKFMPFRGMLESEVICPEDVVLHGGIVVRSVIDKVPGRHNLPLVGPRSNVEDDGVFDARFFQGIQRQVDVLRHSVQSRHPQGPIANEGHEDHGRGSPVTEALNPQAAPGAYKAKGGKISKSLYGEQEDGPGEFGVVNGTKGVDPGIPQQKMYKEEAYDG